MCRSLEANIKEQNNKVKEWYEEFMGKVSNQQKQMIEE